MDGPQEGTAIGGRRRSRPIQPAVPGVGRLLSAQNSAEWLGVPYTTLLDIARRGSLPHVQIPGCRRWWFERRELEAALNRWRETGV